MSQLMSEKNMSFVAELVARELKALLPMPLCDIISIVKDYLYYENEEVESDDDMPPYMHPDIHVGGFIPYGFFERLGCMNANRDYYYREDVMNIKRYREWRQCQTIGTLIHRESYLTKFFQHLFHMVIYLFYKIII